MEIGTPDQSRFQLQSRFQPSEVQTLSHRPRRKDRSHGSGTALYLPSSLQKRFKPILTLYLEAYVRDRVLSFDPTARLRNTDQVSQLLPVPCMGVNLPFPNRVRVAERNFYCRRDGGDRQT